MPPTAPKQLVPDTPTPSGYTRAYTSPSGGFVDIHETHGKGEKPENLHIGKHLADRGEQVRLLPVYQLEGVKNLDATRNDVVWEFKHPTTANAKTALQNAVKDASKQGASRVLLYLNSHMQLTAVVNGLKLAFQPSRAKRMTHVALMLPNGDVLDFTIEQMREHTFINPLKNRGGSQLK